MDDPVSRKNMPLMKEIAFLITRRKVIMIEVLEQEMEHTTSTFWKMKIRKKP